MDYPVTWYLTGEPQDEATAVEPASAGIEIPADVIGWAESESLGGHLLVTVDLPFTGHGLKPGTYSAIRRHVPQAQGEIIARAMWRKAGERHNEP